MPSRSPWVIGAVLLAVAVLGPFLPLWALFILTIAFAKGLVALGLMLFLRAGLISFGHALYFAIAAYAAAFLSASMPGADLVLVLVVAVAGAVLSGIIVGLFVVRYRGIFFGMLNLAFSMIFWSILEKFYHYTGGADGIRLPRPTVFGMALERGPFELIMFYLSVALVVLLGWFTMRWFASPAGQIFQTIKTNETRLQYLGVSPQRALLSGYILSAALCGTGGVIMGIVQGVVTPEFAWWIRSGEMVFIAVLGGAGSVAGAFVGAVIYETIRTYASAFAGDVWQMVLGGFLLVIILFAPKGVIGIYDAALARLTGKGRSE